MSSTWVIAQKELLDLRRDRLFAVLIAFLAVATLISVGVAAASFRTQLDAYNLYVQQLAASGSTTVPAAPQLFPLQLLRGGVEYLEILGALFAIVLGYGTVAKEKYRGTLQLLLSRPVGRFAIPAGKVLGLAVVWFIVVALLTVTTTVAILVIGNAPLQGIDIARILIAAVVAWLYLLFWSALAIGITALSHRLSTGLIVAIVVWLVFVLIIPQIGDTMDPDNQVPGGLFATLQIQKPDELKVLANFAVFDSIRNGLEVSSITKHFERLSFAFLGIKDKYNQQPLGLVWADMWGYAITLAAAILASVTFAVGFTTRRNLQRKIS
ncbi:polyphenol oxidoreductase [Cryobacterium adonitolivorans]|uniref:Polyphenol oxidoreductase n=1 Tax=Cryobacterium adonitolivorans TaxID=1259189 RepID=A0A4R8W740_9MICO|nr:ABC transporter permease [Cryobacterium adonitolivorans]TFC00993.1 polyphenol oxidoreductase [Cryobacterium adonitolivorans]